MSVKLKKNTRFALDILLLLSGLVTLVSSVVVWFVLPRGIGLHGESAYCSGQGVGGTGNVMNFLGMKRYSWITIHNWASVVLAVIILVHIIFHWRWIVETTRRIFRYFEGPVSKLYEVYGAVMILLVLFLFDGLSGLVIWLVIPRGQMDFVHMEQGAGRTFLGLQRNNWVDLHAWNAVLIVAIILIHLFLNWNWVVGAARRIISGSARAAN